MKFILAKKINMSQIFEDDGTVVPVTVLDAGPIVVTQVKTKEKDGYDAIQVGFGEKKASKINKALKGHMKELGNFRTFREMRLINGVGDVKIGDKLDVSMFVKGDKVQATSNAKGKGFQGVVKRHGFKGGRRSHGQKHSEREAGSIGGGGRAGGRVIKGMRMAGRMGNQQVTIKNLVVAGIDPENNQILIRGAIAGRRGSLVTIKG
jgi:large subunit ribosomal protein L3